MVEAATALKALLESDATISGVVAKRIYISTVPDKYNLPLILMHSTSQNCEQNLDGNINGMFEEEFQLDVYANDDQQIATVKNALWALLPSAERTVVVNGANYVIKAITDFVVQAGLIKEPELENCWRMITDFKVWHRGGA